MRQARRVRARPNRPNNPRRQRLRFVLLMDSSPLKVPWWSPSQGAYTPLQDVYPAAMAVAGTIASLRHRQYPRCKITFVARWSGSCRTTPADDRLVRLWLRRGSGGGPQDYRAGPARTGVLTSRTEELRAPGHHLIGHHPHGAGSDGTCSVSVKNSVFATPQAFQRNDTQCVTFACTSETGTRCWKWLKSFSSTTRWLTRSLDGFRMTSVRCPAGASVQTT